MSALLEGLPVGFELGRYRIDGVLGQGGFGITYRGTDQQLDRPVAIKEYFPSDYARREDSGEVSSRDTGERKLFAWGLARFRAEAETLKSMRQVNIVRVMSVFSSGGTVYMVMRYEAGQNLEQALAAGRIGGEDPLLELLRQLINALQRVHDKGFIHRDVKPQNIVLRDNDTPVLIDFGSARRSLSEKTAPMTAIVSPGYAPIEQYDPTGARQGPWTDVYALAAVAFRVMCGAAPPDAMQRMSAVMHDDPDPLWNDARGREGYSEALVQAVDAGLALRAADRPQTVNELRERLKLTVTSNSVSSLRPHAGDAGRGTASGAAADAGAPKGGEDDEFSSAIESVLLRESGHSPAAVRADARRRSGGAPRRSHVGFVWRTLANWFLAPLLWLALLIAVMKLLGLF